MLESKHRRDGPTSLTTALGPRHSRFCIWTSEKSSSGKSCRSECENRPRTCAHGYGQPPSQPRRPPQAVDLVARVYQPRFTPPKPRWHRKRFLLAAFEQRSTGVPMLSLHAELQEDAPGWSGSSPRCRPAPQRLRHGRGENEPGGIWEYPPLTTILLGVACCGRYYEAWR
jgi:hypothetical protein